MLEKCPEIEIKSLEIGNVACEDGYPFTCIVYVDGKRFCLAHDGAFGAPLDYEAISTIDYAKEWGKRFIDALRDIDDRLKKHHPMTEERDGIPPMEVDLEFKVDLLIEEEELWLDMKKKTKKKIMFYDEEKKAFYLCKIHPTEVSIKMFRTRNPDIRLILNSLSREDALRAYKDPEGYLEGVDVQ